MARFAAYRNNEKVPRKYPDMMLYQEIIFLKHYFNGKYVVENVDGYYDPLILPNKRSGRHFLWSNFKISDFDIYSQEITFSKRKDFVNEFGFDLSKFRLNTRKDTIYRNCVHPRTGLSIYNDFLRSIVPVVVPTLF